MGAPDGPFIFRASEPQTLSGDRFLSLTPTTLSFVGRSLGGHDFDGLWVRVVPSTLSMGPPFAGQASQKRYVVTNPAPQLPLACLFACHSLGGHHFDGLSVRAVPWALRMGPSFSGQVSEKR